VGSGFDYTQTFLDVAPVLADGDLTSLNLEGSIYGTPYGDENRSAPVQMLEALQSAGVDLVQTANSYAVINGISGLQQTIAGVKGAGMTPVGTFVDSEAFEKTGGYVIRNVQGVRVAIVAFTKGMDGMGLPKGSEDCVNLLYSDYNSSYQKVDTAGIRKVLRAAQAKAPDVTIALLHWGSEFNDQISKTQKTITTLMLEEGVDAIVGTHSHYVQQVVHDPEKGTLIAYSLGDFFGDGIKAGTNYSILLDIEITKSGVTGKASVTGFSYTPVYIADQTADGKGLQVMRIREAIAAYESNSLGKVPEEVYRGMVAALERIESRVNGT
jgi:poly-gamma-glutamate synthesis protein (capsule biosynthesis protein)